MVGTPLGAPALWGYWAPMGDVRHAAPVEGVGVGVGCLASPVVSRFVVLARVSGYSRRLALVTRVIPLSLHSYFPPTMRSTVAVPTSIARFRPPLRARFPRSTSLFPWAPSLHLVISACRSFSGSRLAYLSTISWRLSVVRSKTFPTYHHFEGPCPSVYSFIYRVGVVYANV